jgi:PAS domain S-box-containing protein
MDLLHWISAASNLLIAGSYLLVILVLVRGLAGKRRSSATLALALFGVLLLIGGLTILGVMTASWWPAPWLRCLAWGVCGLSSMGVACLLVRVIPKAIAFRDLEHLTSAANDLRRSRERFERAVAGSSNGLWEWNLEAGEVWFSLRFKELLGYEYDEFPNHFASWEAALHPDDRERTLTALHKHLNQQGVYDIEYRLLTKSNTYRWFHARGLAIQRPDGTPNLMSGSIQDIHDRKLAETTLRQQEDYLNQKQKLEALGELAGEVAHEFNNVLQALSGQIQFAEHSLSDESTIKKELDTASMLITEAAHFTRQLLDFSRPHCCELKVVSMNEILNRIDCVLRPLLENSIELKVRHGDDRTFVLADPVSLQQALTNLCINARDAMPEGGTLTIAASCAEPFDHELVKLPGVKASDYVRIAVTDTGIGIPEDQQSRIFEPYYTTKSAGKGTGLGLAIVYSVVKEHGGMICCDSWLGRGSTFTIWLPIAPCLAAQSQSEKPPVSRTEGRRRETILYAEDNKAIRRATCHLLRSEGYRLIAARDGLDAIRQFDRHVDEIDLAVLDIVMPKLEGDEVLRHLREAQPKLPVVFCSGNTPQRICSGIFRSEHTRLVTKPYTKDVLLKAVRDAADSRWATLTIV